MGFEFNADEILQIAERIENNGALFYRLAADQCANARERELFLGLAISEDGHKETFAGMRKELSEEESAPLTFCVIGRFPSTPEAAHSCWSIKKGIPCKSLR
jgi:hypothetical protein